MNIPTLVEKTRIVGYAPQLKYFGKCTYDAFKPFAKHHPTLNFIFISSPQDELKHSVYINKKLFRTAFPMLIIHMPGCFYENKVKRPFQTEELYLSYDFTALNYFKPILSNFNINCSEIIPPYQLNISPLMSELFNIITTIMENIYLPGNLDKLDRFCELIIIEALINRVITNNASNSLDQANSKIRKIASFIEMNSGNVDLDSLISNYNLSRRSFFRQWRKVFDVPPYQYILRLKLDHAASLLRVTRLQVKEIAERTNFCDSYHFTKMFKSFYGMSPIEYRKSPNL